MALRPAPAAQVIRRIAGILQGAIRAFAQHDKHNTQENTREQTHANSLWNIRFVGGPGASAASTTRMLLAFKAEAMLASLSFCSMLSYSKRLASTSRFNN